MCCGGIKVYDEGYIRWTKIVNTYSSKQYSVQRSFKFIFIQMDCCQIRAAQYLKKNWNCDIYFFCDILQYDKIQEMSPYTCSVLFMYKWTVIVIIFIIMDTLKLILFYKNRRFSHSNFSFTYLDKLDKPTCLSCHLKFLTMLKCLPDLRGGR